MGQGWRVAITHWKSLGSEVMGVLGEEIGNERDCKACRGFFILWVLGRELPCAQQSPTYLHVLFAQSRSLSQHTRAKAFRSRSNIP